MDFSDSDSDSNNYKFTKDYSFVFHFLHLDLLNKSVRTISNWIKELEDNLLIERIQVDYNSPSKTFIIPYTVKYNSENFLLKPLYIEDL